MEGRLYHIGRDKNNEICIYEDSISAKHAQIYFNENHEIAIVDLGSTNGTIINGLKIKTPTKLKKGDEIILGNLTLKSNDIINAIRFLEKNNLSAVDFLSYLNKRDTSQNKNTDKIFNLSKVLTIVLFILFTTGMIFIGVNYFGKQNEIKKEILKTENGKKNPKENSKIDSKNSDKKKPNKEKTKKKETKSNQVNKTKKKDHIKQRTDVRYDFSCLADRNDAGSNELIIEFGDLTRNIQGNILKDIDISIDDEKDAGNGWVRDLKNKKKFINQGKDYRKLKRILSELTRSLAKPRGVKYEIYLVDDKVENVFTLGGNIIFYMGMYKICKNDSEIASIIAHEIAHNELGHSTLQLKKQKLSKDFGILGEIALAIEDDLSKGFNQKQEAEADLFGFDLIYSTKYESCAGIGLWKRMSQNEKDFNIADNLFKSHPYSIKRSECIERHYRNNYNRTCTK